MIVGSFYDLSKSDSFHVGDTIWACEFQAQIDKEKVHLIQKPVKGVIMAGKSKKEHERRLSEGRFTSLSYCYFVPLKKDGTPAWSKSVQLCSRHYATDEGSCKVLYNELVGRHMNWLNTQISWAREQLIEAPDPMTVYGNDRNCDNEEMEAER